MGTQLFCFQIQWRIFKYHLFPTVVTTAPWGNVWLKLIRILYESPVDLHGKSIRCLLNCFFPPFVPITGEQKSKDLIHSLTSAAVSVNTVKKNQWEPLIAARNKHSRKMRKVSVQTNFSFFVLVLRRMLASSICYCLWVVIITLVSLGDFWHLVKASTMKDSHPSKLCWWKV